MKLFGLVQRGFKGEFKEGFKGGFKGGLKPPFKPNLELFGFQVSAPHKPEGFQVWLNPPLKPFGVILDAHRDALRPWKMPDGRRVARTSREDRGRVVIQASEVHRSAERRGEQVLHRQDFALKPSGHRDRLGLWRRGRRGSLALRSPCQRPRPEAVLGDEFNPEAAGAFTGLHVAVQVCIRGHPDLARVEFGSLERAEELHVSEVQDVGEHAAKGAITAELPAARF